MDIEECYKILAIKVPRDESHIKKASRKKAKEYHLDNNGNASADAMEKLIEARNMLLKKRCTAFESLYKLYKQRGRKNMTLYRAFPLMISLRNTASFIENMAIRTLNGFAIG